MRWCDGFSEGCECDACAAKTRLGWRDWKEVLGSLTIVALMLAGILGMGYLGAALLTILGDALHYIIHCRHG